MSEAANVYLYVMSFSLIINIFVFGFLKFTGLGQACWERFIWRIKFRNGNYAYSLMLTNSGKLEEVFEPIKDQLFSYENGKYNRNPKMTVLFKGIPAHFHREGIVEPVDPYNTVDADIHKLSTQELDNIMSANQDFDIMEWFEKNKMLFLVAVGVVVIGVVVAAYYGYQNNELLSSGVNAVGSVVNPR